ncbi:MAG: hemin ABC transporter substrate-binding protein [Sneathiella sp.]
MMKFILSTIFLILSINASHAQQSDRRIVSIGGALTETIYALGRGSSLVGSDTTSYFPSAAAKLPKTGYQRALSVEGVLSLKPDLIIATEDAGPPSVIKQIASTGVQINHFKSAKSIEETRENILALGQTLDAMTAAKSLIEIFDTSLARLKVATSKQTTRPQVLFIMNHGSSTPMAAGSETSAHSIIELAGGINVAAAYAGYKPISPEAVVKFSPEVILITSRTLKQIGGKDALFKLPGLALTPAAKSGNVIDMDGLLLLGFGPRSAAAALELNERLNAHD